jgi:cyanophycinase
VTRSFALLGSGEFEPWSEEVDRWMLARATRPDAPVLILPTACAPEGKEIWDTWANMGLKHFAGLEVPAEVLDLKTRQDGHRPDLVAKLRVGSFVYFSGGNPAYLAEVLRDSPFWTALTAEVERGLGYAGCSAGVAALGERAIDSSSREFTAGMWKPGLRLFPNVEFGPHWDMLEGYVPGLQTMIAQAVPRDSRLFAIDERTAAVGDGIDWSVIGLGKVHLMEGGEWRRWAAGESFSAPLVGPA